MELLYYIQLLKLSGNVVDYVLWLSILADLNEFNHDTIRRFSHPKRGLVWAIDKIINGALPKNDNCLTFSTWKWRNKLSPLNFANQSQLWYIYKEVYPHTYKYIKTKMLAKENGRERKERCPQHFVKKYGSTENTKLQIMHSGWELHRVN